MPNIAPRAVTVRQIDTATRILGAISTENHEELDGALRDEIGHVIYALEQIADRRRR